jgi:hypothetical protein
LCIPLPPPCVEPSFPSSLLEAWGGPVGPRTAGGDHSPALRGLRLRGRDRRGPARAGGWPGARGRDAMRGEGWRRDAEGETVPTPQTPTIQHTVVLHKVARYCARARAANVSVLTRGRRSSANLCVAFLKALLLAIACGLSALWARAGVCCGPIAPRGPNAQNH